MQLDMEPDLNKAHQHVCSVLSRFEHPMMHLHVRPARAFALLTYLVYGCRVPSDLSLPREKHHERHVGRGDINYFLYSTKMPENHMSEA